MGSNVPPKRASRNITLCFNARCQPETQTGSGSLEAFVRSGCSNAVDCADSMIFERPCRPTNRLRPRPPPSQGKRIEGRHNCTQSWSQAVIWDARLAKITDGETHAMHNVSIQKASELPPRLKSAVEELLGRPIDAEEDVGIAAVPPQQISTSRPLVAEKLEAFLGRRAAMVSDVSDDELDAVIDEAVDRLRHSRG